MNKFRDIDEYFMIINLVTKENMPVITNCYLYQDKIQKMIDKERIYYEKVNGGILLYVDEKEYYQLYYYLNIAADWKIERKDKDIVIKNIYVEGRKSKQLELFEKKIKEMGFHLLDSLGQVECDVQVLKRKIEKPYNAASRLLMQNGFMLVEPDLKMIPQIRELQKNAENIPIYQIPYVDDEELIVLGREKQIFCIIDKSGDICGIRVFLEKNSTYGYLVVKEEYQKKYGMAIIFSNLTIKHVGEKNIKPLGWITITNAKSVKYHMHLGYQWTGKYMDEWILRTA